MINEWNVGREGRGETGLAILQDVSNESKNVV